MDEWVTKTEGKRKTSRSTLTADRDQPNTYLQIVAFPSYEEAMANSSFPRPAIPPNASPNSATARQPSAISTCAGSTTCPERVASKADSPAVRRT